MKTCPDLATLAGDRYRVTFETPLDQRPTPSIKADPWAATVPCRGGDHIFPWGPGRLAVHLLGRRPGLTRLLVAAGCVVHTKGDDGVTLTFPVELFGRVAVLTRARKRRKLSPEHRAKLIAAGKPFPKRHESKSREMAPVSPQTTSVDLEHVQGASTA